MSDIYRLKKGRDGKYRVQEYVYRRPYSPVNPKHWVDIDAKGRECEFSISLFSPGFMKKVFKYYSSKQEALTAINSWGKKEPEPETIELEIVNGEFVEVSAKSTEKKSNE